MPDVRLTDEAFINALDDACTCGSDSVECVCGRFFFNGDHRRRMNEDEAKELEEKMAQDPDKFIERDYTILTFDIGQGRIVTDCPCERALAFTRFIWSMRYTIADFLESCAKKISAANTEALGVAKRAKQAVES